MAQIELGFADTVLQRPLFRERFSRSVGVLISGTNKWVSIVPNAEGRDTISDSSGEQYLICLWGLWPIFLYYI